MTTLAILATLVGVASPWSWSLSTTIAATGLAMVAIAHTIAAVVFFVRWSVAVRALRGDFEEYTKQADQRFAALGSRVHEDLKAIEAKLDSLSRRQEDWVALGRDVANLSARVSRLER